MNNMNMISLVGLTAINVVKGLAKDGFFFLANYNRPIAIVIKPEFTRAEFDAMVERLRGVMFPKP